MVVAFFLFVFFPSPGRGAGLQGQAKGHEQGPEQQADHSEEWYGQHGAEGGQDIHGASPFK